jgi:hypothetical protein
VTYSIGDDRFEIDSGELAGWVALTFAEARELRAALNDWQNVKRLRPDKLWGECSYEGHADDCTCNGMGGDR